MRFGIRAVFQARYPLVLVSRFAILVCMCMCMYIYITTYICTQIHSLSTHLSQLAAYACWQYL